MNISNKSFGIGAIALGADILTYLQVLPKLMEFIGVEFPQWNSLVVNLMKWFVYISASFVLLLVIIYNILKMYFTRIGTHQIPCAIYNMFIYKFTNMNEKILRVLHRDLYHKICIEKKKIEKQKISDVYEAQSIIDSVIQQFHASLYHLFKIDLSISVKIITNQNTDTCLRSLIYHRGVREGKIAGSRKLDNIYILLANESDDLSVYTSLARSYTQKNGNSKYKKNSVYDYILSTTHNSWISNDLGIDEQNGLFYSSSENYNAFYKSMAAFAIIPPEHETDKGNVIKGVLTFDSIKTGLFSEKECNWLMGYMAHLLYEIFKAIEDNGKS